MSAGAIKAEREAFGKREPVSTTDTARVCGVGAPGRGYCGRKAKGDKVTADWALVKCSDCAAAKRADEQVDFGGWEDR